MPDQITSPAPENVPVSPDVAPVSSPDRNRAKAATILVVDDVEGNRAVVCRRLEHSGYDLHQVASGEEALLFIREKKVDLVLLDYMMPNMNGIDVLRVLRDEWQMKSLPVIMLTARAEGQAQVEALGAGADDYVTKPIDFEVLHARISSQLERQKNSNQLRQAHAAQDERAAIRVLAIDKLQDELEREIGRRREAEQALAACGGDDQGPGPQAPQSKAGISRALEIIDAIGRNTDAGKPVNRALLNQLRSLVEELG